MSAVTRVSVDYVFSEEFGKAEVNYCFEVGHLFPLVSGYVVPVEKVQPGMQFYLDNGAIATVTAVEPPRVWEPPPSEPNEDGNYLRRVIGRIKRTGFMVLDLVFGGQAITTTPGHLFYSLDRRGWVGAEALHVGEALQSDKGERLRLDGKGRIRHGRIELYNIEVEQLHTYFVGRTPGQSALVHNGTPVPGAPGCIPLPARNAPEAGGFARGIHPDEIVAINRSIGGSAIIGSHPSSAVAAASMHQGFWNKTAAITRSIVNGHMFNDGNKRTAAQVIDLLRQRNGVITGVSARETQSILNRIARGELRDVEEIARLLRGF